MSSRNPYRVGYCIVGDLVSRLLRTEQVNRRDAKYLKWSFPERGISCGRVPAVVGRSCLLSSKAGATVPHHT